jgi:hypothetical protein
MDLFGPGIDVKLKERKKEKMLNQTTVEFCSRVLLLRQTLCIL